MFNQLVQLKDVKKSYRLGKTGVDALRGINLGVRSGEFMVLTGPSGSGKSTLLNIIGCLDSPTSGSYMLDGREIVHKDFDKLAQLRNDYVGFIFQDFNLIPVLDIYENVEFPLTVRQDAIDKEYVEGIIDRVGLSEYKHHRPDELSGGQRQRVAVARALVTKPAFILADEPTANLDSNNARNIVQLMMELNESLGVTFLFSSHDPRLLDHAKRIVSLEDGLIVDDRRCC